MKDTVEYIIEKGKRYKPAKLPEGIERGLDGRCFDNSIGTVLRFPQYKYVEGITANPTKKNEWIVHAWITDGVHAFDLSWYALDEKGEVQPVPTIYIGFEIELSDICSFVRSTQYLSILYNMNKNLELARKCIPGIPAQELPQAFEIFIED